MLKIFKKIFFFKEIFLSEGKWSVFWNKFGNILFVKMEFSKRNNYSARDPTYLVIQLSYICTTSQVTYLVSENVNWAEPKIVPFEACKGCCWGTLGEDMCKKWHTILPKSCLVYWYKCGGPVPSCTNLNSFPQAKKTSMLYFCYVCWSPQSPVKKTPLHINDIQTLLIKNNIYVHKCYPNC